MLKSEAADGHRLQTSDFSTAASLVLTVGAEGPGENGVVLVSLPSSSWWRNQPKTLPDFRPDHDMVTRAQSIRVLAGSPRLSSNRI